MRRAIVEIAQRHGLKVVEDAAQGVMSAYKGRALGTIGDFGCFSFHETKNYSMGEGGAFLTNDMSCAERAEILREKGTDRSKFLRGQVDKYTWQDYGSSYLPSDINAAYLWAQLEKADEINENRLVSWNAYDAALRPLAERGLVELPTIPVDCVHNAHMYWLKAADLDERTRLIAHLKFGRFDGEEEFTTRESNRLLRLPMYYNLAKDDLLRVVDAIYEFYGVSR